MLQWCHQKPSLLLLALVLKSGKWPALISLTVEVLPYSWLLELLTENRWSFPFSFLSTFLSYVSSLYIPVGYILGEFLGSVSHYTNSLLNRV